MERKEFEDFVDEQLEAIRREWIKYGPEEHPLSLTVWHDATAAVGFVDLESGAKCIDYFRWHHDSDS